MQASSREVTRCRICGNTELPPVLSLGTQCLTGLFPRADSSDPPAGPLDLVKCHGGDDACGLLQLKHSYDGSLMYGAAYGYRSSLNRGMVEHLRAKIQGLASRLPIGKGDFVLDIGSNDGTSLSFYPKDGPTLIGIDPTAAKFAQYYQPHIRVVPDFFSAAAFRKAAGSDSARAKIVTSISMFYDLEDPMHFMREVRDILADDGIWHFEQSYMPAMLEANAYDTVCHEHIEYYALHQIVWMARRVGFSVVDVEFNDVNGGSFAVTVRKTQTPADAPNITELLRREQVLALDTLAPYRRFAERVARHRDQLRTVLDELRASGKRVFGLGASTKGNVILQYCEIGRQDLEYIAEVNPDKFGCVTPGTQIPIISEAKARELGPDVFCVLPWHFRQHFIEREQQYIKGGGRLLFPLPAIATIPG